MEQQFTTYFLSLKRPYLIKTVAASCPFCVIVVRRNNVKT